MPARATIDEWRRNDDDFASRVARARDIGFDAIADECAAIADTPLAGQIVTVEDGKEKVVTEDMLGHRKLQVETRLKLLACWDPRRYGNKQQVEHSGGLTLAQLIAGSRQAGAGESGESGESGDDGPKAA